MSSAPPARIDHHVHVAVLGDKEPFQRYGAISPWMREQLTFRIMLLYARIGRDQVSDPVLRDTVVETIRRSSLDQVVCLALDAVHDHAGNRCEDRSNLWVDNAYITEVLMPLAPGRILLGASVHPYDPGFRRRVEECVANGAVLLKWLPSAQQINLADPRVRAALEFLATAKPGNRPLPLLLHVGAEYAIMTTDPRTTSWDFLSWGPLDRVRNQLRARRARWATPDIPGVRANLRAGLEAGAQIILAHCGLPYFAPPFLRFLEHDDFPVVRDMLAESHANPGRSGRCYADVSACVSPFRKGYFQQIRKLPEELLLAGSDFPVPVFELSAGLEENLRDLEAMVMRGELDRVVVPQDNLLDVNWRELRHAFGDHQMFYNAAELLR